MSTEFFRKFADMITEAETPPNRKSISESTRVSVDSDDFNPTVGDIITDTVFGNVKLLKITEVDANNQFASGIVQLANGTTQLVTFEVLVGNE